MVGIIGIIALLTVLALSLIITRVATVALTMTGLSEETAHFQARSAFTGTGFTTSEAENVVNHPVRRRIIMVLMILRSAGLVTIVLSLIISFLGPSDDIAKIARLVWLVSGVAVLWLLSRSKTLDRCLERVIDWALRRWTELDVSDYASLLRLSGEYRVMEVQVQNGDWLAGKNLQRCYLPEEGVMVLGITRGDGRYIGGPKGDTEIYPGDTLILYGRAQKLRELDRRADITGDQAHDSSIREQKQHMEEQNHQEREYKRKREAAAK
jgi:NhaP-type Na+/H+ and K+/H+ antiporter